MHRLSLHLTALALALGVSFSASAQDAAAVQGAKVVFVQLERVYSDSVLIQQIREKIELEFKEREEDVLQVVKDIRERRNRLEKDSLTMGADEKEVIRQEIDRLERQLNREDTALREDRNLRFSEYRQRLEPRILRIIGQIAQEGEHEIVLDFVLFGRTSANITEEVITLLDEQVSLDDLE